MQVKPGESKVDLSQVVGLSASVTWLLDDANSLNDLYLLESLVLVYQSLDQTNAN